MTYTVGALVRLSATFTDADGDPANPTTVTFKTKAPDNSIANYVFPDDAAVINPTAGSFYVDITVDQSGAWCYRAEGAGTVQAASEADFEVDESCFE